jgi:limonene-1,2-epoxide hydrolase
MQVGTTLIAATIALVLSLVFQAARAQEPDPASVLKRYIEALNAGDLDTALAQWAEDGAITNTRGRRSAGHERLRQFIQGNIARKIKQEPEQIKTVGDKVTWINRESNESYRKLDVAPVQQNSEIVVREGKISSWINYFPSSEIARIEQACTAPQAQGVLLNDQPCGEFVEQAKAQTAKVLGTGPSERR